MLPCGHEREPFGSPLCPHLALCRQPWIDYVRWYTGNSLDVELLCKTCESERQNGQQVATERVCRECFNEITITFARLDGVGGTPGIRLRTEPFSHQIRESKIPENVGRIIDIVPLTAERRSIWLLLSEGGEITRFEAETGASTLLIQGALISEPDHQPWCDLPLKPHLYASPEGEFAAVVNDYGRYGRIIDLRSGRVTLSIDGENNDSETVPFSFAFAKLKGGIVAIHRTDWNRLDISDPATGQLLTPRDPAELQDGNRGDPPHDLDYYHGALHVSPNHSRIADDGWIWHPAGMVWTWKLEPWRTGNVWESEDGPTRLNICNRTHYWGHAMTWLDEDRIAIGGIGEHESSMIDGVRIFDTSVLVAARTCWDSDSLLPREEIAFAGPAGRFFCSGDHFFSSDPSGLSRWDMTDGSCTAHVEQFQPIAFHPGSREFVQIVDNSLIRLALK